MQNMSFRGGEQRSNCLADPLSDHDCPGCLGAAPTYESIEAPLVRAGPCDVAQAPCRLVRPAAPAMNRPNRRHFARARASVASCCDIISPKHKKDGAVSPVQNLQVQLKVSLTLEELGTTGGLGLPYFLYVQQRGCRGSQEATLLEEPRAGAARSRSSALNARGETAPACRRGRHRDWCRRRRLAFHGQRRRPAC